MIGSPGLHHITAVTSDPQRNVDFFTRVLGQRFVKRTVNFDDPSAYHLYYGDYLGSPGTAMTYFCWSNLPSRVPGVGEVSSTYYRISPNSYEFWSTHLSEQGIKVTENTLFSVPTILLTDPDGHMITLVVCERPPTHLELWDSAPVPAKHHLRGFYGVLMTVQRLATIEPVLTEVFGMQRTATTDGIVRYSNLAEAETVVDVVEQPHTSLAQPGVGSVHHIAFRAFDDDHRKELRSRALAIGLQPTGLVDRLYFHCTYFMTLAGILIEIATDKPGFTVNEDAASLGQRLVLPPQFESIREQITASLPPISVP